VTFDSRPYNHKAKLFIDGNFEGETFVPDPFPFVNNLTVGFRDNYYSPISYNYFGDIDDLFLLSSVLTPEQVKKIYDSNKPFKWPIEVRNPVLIVPGIMGSYLKRASDGKELWPNIDGMLFSADDQFLYELEMDNNGISKNNINIGDIVRKIAAADVLKGLIKELEDSGYVENQSLFVLPYDWRQDIAISAGVTLKNKIDELKDLTGKVDIVAHSMGGLVFKKYIYDFGTSSIGKFVDLATPHLGSPKISKVLIFGDDLGITLGFLGANQNTVKNISQNMMSSYELLPSPKYFDLQDNDYRNYLYNEEYLLNPLYLPQANMDYDDSMLYLGLTGRNEYLLPYNQLLHDQIDNVSFENSYNIVGCGQATIGKIWFKGKDKSGEDKYDITYINGDGTVPLRSATYFREPISYARAEHGGISAADGVKELVASILAGDENGFDYNSYDNISRNESVCSFTGYTVTIHSPISLNVSTADGRQIGPDVDGNIQNNINGASYDILGGNKFAFVPATGEKYIISGKAESAGKFDMRVKKIVDGQIVETTLFYNLPLNSAESEVETEISELGELSLLQYDAQGDGVFEKTISPSSILADEQQDDIIAPTTTVNISGEEVGSSTYMLSANFNFTANDGDGAGVLGTYYQIDANGWQKYSDELKYEIIGKHIIEYYSVDKAGNEEETKIINFNIIEPTAAYLKDRINNLYDQGEIFKPAVKNYFDAQLTVIIKKQKEMADSIAKWREKLGKEAAKCDQRKYPKFCQNIIKELEKIVGTIEAGGEKFIDHKYAEMIKMLELYYSKNWLSQSAYDIIKIRINYFVKIL
jgi:triacylglycerol esterase/lipase EstA (alpha/beta hydrolase family)